MDLRLLPGYDTGSRKVWIANEIKDDGHRYIAKAETLSTAFIEFEYNY